MYELLRLFWGTILLRPYVFVFLAVYLVAGWRHIGWKKTLAYIPLGYAIAWVSEYSSIHWGFPYGDYFYIQSTMHTELWVLGVPFMDSLSYVFLSYCSYSLAAFLMSPVTLLSGNLITLDTFTMALLADSDSWRIPFRPAGHSYRSGRPAGRKLVSGPDLRIPSGGDLLWNPDKQFWRVAARRGCPDGYSAGTGTDVSRGFKTPLARGPFILDEAARTGALLIGPFVQYRGYFLHWRDAAGPRGSAPVVSAARTDDTIHSL